MAVAAKGLVVTAVGPAGALALAVKKGRPVGGWGRAATTALTARSQEVVATA
jgi:hypothetical protein